MFCNTYKVKTSDGGIDYEFIAMWVRTQGDDDVLIMTDDSLSTDGPLSVTYGHNWDFKDVDIVLRTDVAQLFYDFNDPEESDEHEMLFYCIEYEQMESGLLASA